MYGKLWIVIYINLSADYKKHIIITIFFIKISIIYLKHNYKYWKKSYRRIPTLPLPTSLPRLSTNYGRGVWLLLVSTFKLFNLFFSNILIINNGPYRQYIFRDNRISQFRVKMLTRIPAAISLLFLQFVFICN